MTKKQLERTKIKLIKLSVLLLAVNIGEKKKRKKMKLLVKSAFLLLFTDTVTCTHNQML